MIDLYSGTPGSGKSLHVAMRVYWGLRMKRTVVTNFSIDVSKIGDPAKLGRYIEVSNDELTPQKLIEVSREHFAGRRIIEDDILVVIDEAQLLFNAREWGKKGRSDWLSFFSQHRKYGCHVILVAQFDLMLDKQIRSLIEYEYIHRKVGNFGARGKVLSALAGGKLHVAVQVWYPMREKVGSEFFRANKRYYSIYDTYNTFR